MRIAPEFGKGKFLAGHMSGCITKTTLVKHYNYYEPILSHYNYNEPILANNYNYNNQYIDQEVVHKVCISKFKN